MLSNECQCTERRKCGKKKKDAARLIYEFEKSIRNKKVIS